MVLFLYLGALKTTKLGVESQVTCISQPCDKGLQLSAAMFSS